MPLEGIRVLDWTIWQQGPVATMMLADLGADVIKIESREGGDPGRGMESSGGVDLNSRLENAYFEGNNRNKRSIALDLKHPEGRDIVRALAKASDVFAHNFREGVPERLGLGYDDLKAGNEKLIYAAASGYGPEGPDSGEPSFDLIGQARSGLMMAVGEPGMPPLPVGGGVSDQVGAIMLCHGIMTALLARERFGVGQRVDTSHLGSMAWMQGLALTFKLLAEADLPRAARAEAANPLWNVYQCSDGEWLCLSMLQADRYWGDVCKVVGREDMIVDERFATPAARDENCGAAVAELDAEFIKRPWPHWNERLKAGGDLIFCRVQTVGELASDEQMIKNDYVVDFEHPNYGTIRQVGLPLTLSETPGGLRLPAPEHGQHTEEVLIDVLGYSWDDIGELRKKEVL
jgi:crotonobetainyl-CoA:carnitine CoA-transferase CaiB-like acyl-CoA transferase